MSGRRPPIPVAWRVRPRPCSDAAVRSAVRAALAEGRREDIEVGVVLVSDPELAELHGRWLGDPSPTDVIAFDLDDGLGGPSGEVWVSVDRARAVAAERRVDVASELQLYVVHGTLHLCGHDDLEPAAKRRMRAAEARALDRLGSSEIPRTTRPRRKRRLPS